MNIHLGEAIGQNPGYLKLRKIRAAQNIARTVSLQVASEFHYFCVIFRSQIHKIESILVVTV